MDSGRCSSLVLGRVGVDKNNRLHSYKLIFIVMSVIIVIVIAMIIFVMSTPTILCHFVNHY